AATVHGRERLRRRDQPAAARQLAVAVQHATRQHRGGPRAAEEGDAAVTLSDVAETEMKSREGLREPHAGYDAVQDDSAVALREQSPSAVERRVSRALLAGRDAEQPGQPPLRLIRAGLRVDDAQLHFADERSTA